MIGLKPLVSTWANAIKAAEKDRAPWLETADMCRQFYSGSVGFMWNQRFRQKHLNNLPECKFQITIAKAFELVSIVGPTLMWNLPGRVATGYEKLEIPPEFWQDQAQGAQWDQEYQHELAAQTTRNNLMQHYLNYTPREQPGGGLKTDSQMAIIDSLVTGRGVIRVDHYEPEGGTGALTGGFYVNPEDLFIDPDCTRSNLSNAKWIAIKHCEPHWEVERKFGWPDGSLKGKSTLSTKKAAASQSQTDGTFKGKSETQDIIVWFEVFSKMGAGTRFKDCKLGQWHDAFEQLGDYAYICFVSGMNEPLNLRSSFLESADMDQAKAALDWPTPYYKDGRWPVALLDYWLQPEKPWPLAPLAMGLGELIFLNVFISSLADKIYQDGLVKAAVAQELCEDAVNKLLSYQHEVISLNPAVGKNINELVSYLQRPQTNFDAFRMIEYVSMMFDKRVGLMELMYGLNPGGKVSRTAADANIKGEAVSTRPEFMGAQVEHWQTEIANLERIAAGYHVLGDTLSPLLGRMGAQLWTELINNADQQVYMREMRCRIEANSIRKPNKAKETQNMQQVSGFTLPVLQWYAQSTGNTTPLNEFFQMMGKSMEQDMDGLMMPPIPQQGPSPEQQEAAELNKQKQITDVQGRTLKNEKLMHEMMQAGAGVPAEMLASADIDPEAMSQQPIPEGMF